MARKFFITTSIAYANASPHIGYALELIQADVIARYRRHRGDSVFFATGTDEHGVKIVRRAEELHTTSHQLVDDISEEFRSLRSSLGLSWDVFVRTSDQKHHWPVAQVIWERIYKNGDLYRKAYEGLYCVGHEAFITDKDMKNGVCEIHKKPPEMIREENWFFRLSRYSRQIEVLLTKKKLRIFPESRKNEMLSFIREGLEDVSFSRPAKDLSWGIPVPDDPTQTIYVWADALTNYLSAIFLHKKIKPNFMGAEFKKWWPADVHVIGKDILRFHSLIWIGMLLSAKLPIPKSLLVHGFITVNGEKMSKSLGNVLSPDELIKIYGVDALRYYLLREIASTEDGDISLSKMSARYSGDLANGLGNLVARVAALGQNISPLNFSLSGIPAFIKKELKTRTSAYSGHMDEFCFNEALGEIWQIIGFADRYINIKKPWAAKDHKKLSEIILNASFLILSIKDLLRPFVPHTSDKIEKQFLLKKNMLAIKKGASLFPRIP